MRVLLQIPEGLKKKAEGLVRDLEAKGNEVFLSAEPTWGACDIKVDEAKRLGCEKIVHVGHTKFLDSNFPVEYVELRSDVDVKPAFEKDYKVLSAYKNIGLISSLQFLDTFSAAQNFLEAKGHAVLIGNPANAIAYGNAVPAKAGTSRKYLYPGQVLGCDVTAAQSIDKQVDCFLYIGSGKFHALGALLRTEKPVFCLDVERFTISKLDDKPFLKQKYASIALAKDAKKIGILVSTKIGQKEMQGSAFALKKRIEAKGKEAIVITADDISQDKLLGIGVDAYVFTACPRIVVENRAVFNKPILNVEDLNEALL